MTKLEIVSAIISDLKFDSDRMADFNNEMVNLIIIHHTGVNIDQYVETIHDYHKNVKAWAGIAYHYYIRFNGNIYEGRPLSKVGAHTENQNNRSIGVALAGDYDREKLAEDTKIKQYNALLKLLQMLIKKYPEARIGFHDEFANTSCPGRNFPKEKLLREVNNQQVNKQAKNKQAESTIIQRNVKGTFNGEKIEEEAYMIKGRTYIPVRLLERWFDNVHIKWNDDKGEYHIEA